MNIMNNVTTIFKLLRSLLIIISCWNLSRPYRSSVHYKMWMCSHHQHHRRHCMVSVLFVSACWMLSVINHHIIPGHRMSVMLCQWCSTVSGLVLYCNVVPVMFDSVWTGAVHWTQHSAPFTSSWTTFLSLALYWPVSTVTASYVQAVSVCVAVLLALVCNADKPKQAVHVQT